MIFPVIDPIETGKNITKLRKEKGLSRQNLANLLYLKYCTVWAWEVGKQPPGVDNLIALAFLFEVKLDDLVAIKDDLMAIEEIENEVPDNG